MAILGVVDYVSLIVIDIDGRMRAVSLPSSFADEAVLKKGIGFDASNFGYAKCMHRTW